MSGVVEIVLTDKELDYILSWPKGLRMPIGGDEMSLYRKLEGYKHALECRPTLCAPRDLDPNAP